MKIRNGFVSNSSSSSFVIMGIKRDFDSLNQGDIQRGNIKVVGEYFDCGCDWFVLTQAMHHYIKTHPDKELHNDLNFWEVYNEGEDGFYINKASIPQVDNLEVFPMDVDYHETKDLEEFIERYGKEDD